MQELHTRIRKLVSISTRFHVRNKSQYIHFVFQNSLKIKHLFKLRSPKWLDIVKVKFVSFLRQPLQIDESFSVPLSSQTLHTGESAGELLKVVPVNNASTAPVIYLGKLLLLSLAVFTVTVGAEE